MKPGIMEDHKHLVKILRDNYFPDDIQAVTHVVLYEKDLDAVERNIHRTFDVERGLEDDDDLDLEDEGEPGDADLMGEFCHLIECLLD